MKVILKLDSLLKKQQHSDVYYASGHEHSLEYFFNGGIHYIVSGAGSRIDKVQAESTMKPGECLQWNEEGFFEIDFYDQKETVWMHHRKSVDAPLQVTCLSGCN